MTKIISGNVQQAKHCILWIIFFFPLGMEACSVLFSLAEAERLASLCRWSLLSALWCGRYLRTGAEAAAVPMEIKWGSAGEADELWIKGHAFPRLEVI